MDFSSRGIQVASQEFVKKGYNSQFQVADACDLQFPPGSFDAVFSAHMLYHIENSEAQRKALSEMVRVLRPGGVVVLVLANPRPILFPLRLGIRLVAERPLLRRMAANFRGPSLLPYNPQTIRWTRSALTDLDDVTVVTANLASTAFNQNVSETSFFGSRIWRLFDWLSRVHPRTAAHLGNYVIVTGRKP